MALSFVNSAPKGLSSGTSLSSNSFSYAAGDVIVVDVTLGTPASHTLTDTNGLTWTLLDSIVGSSGAYTYYAQPASSGSTVVTLSVGSTNALFLQPTVYSDAGLPIAVGKANIGYITSDTPFSQVFNPASANSALRMMLVDWTGHWAIASPAANCTYTELYLDAFNSHTTASLTPTTNPRADNSSFTLGGTASSGNTICWLAYEVPLADNGPPTIDGGPNSRSGNAGGEASFSVTVTQHGGTGLSHQWERNDGGGWVDVGTDSPTYTQTGIDASMDGWQYRCTATDTEGSVTSSAATLSVITSWPDLSAMGELAFGEFEDEPSAGPGGVIGTANITEAPDTLSATGVVSIRAAATITEGGDTLSASASVSVQATATITEAADTLSGTASVAVEAVGNVTEDPDTLTATGEVGLAGVTAELNITEAPDTLSATASVQVSASAAINESPDTLTASGSVAVQAQATVTESPDTVAATAEVGLPTVIATANITEAPDTVTATAEVTVTPDPVPVAAPASGPDDDMREHERQLRRARIIKQNNTLIQALVELVAEGEIA